MNLNQLKYFRTLADYQHVTNAAQQLYISQPSLSNAIKSLEKELNCDLFKHCGRNVQLTEYGRMFYTTTCDVLNILEQGEKNLAQKVKQDQGIIDIACVPTSIGTLLPSIISTFQNNSTNSPYFILHNEFSLEICKGIVDGKYDIGICSHAPEFNDLSFVPFFSEQIVVLTKKNNSLAHNKVLTPSQLRGKRIITYSKKFPIGQEIHQELEARCPHLNIITKNLKDELTIAGLVKANNDIGIVANTIFLDTFDLAKIPLDIPSDTHCVYIVYDGTHQLSPELKEFIDFLKKTKQQLKRGYNNELKYT